MTTAEFITVIMRFAGAVMLLWGVWDLELKRGLPIMFGVLLMTVTVTL